MGCATKLASIVADPIPIRESERTLNPAQFGYIPGAGSLLLSARTQANSISYSASANSFNSAALPFAPTTRFTTSPPLKRMRVGIDVTW